MKKAGVVAVMMMKEVEVQDEVAMRGGEPFPSLIGLQDHLAGLTSAVKRVVDQLDSD